MIKHEYTGRIDSDRKERFHQVVQSYTNETKSDVIVGFMSDEGVKRNKGRVGAKEAPVSYTHLTLPTIHVECRSRWSPYH